MGNERETYVLQRDSITMKTDSVGEIEMHGLQAERALGVIDDEGNLTVTWPNINSFSGPARITDIWYEGQHKGKQGNVLVIRRKSLSPKEYLAEGKPPSLTVTDTASYKPKFDKQKGNS